MLYSLDIELMAKASSDIKRVQSTQTSRCAFNLSGHNLMFLHALSCEIFIIVFTKRKQYLKSSVMKWIQTKVNISAYEKTLNYWPML